MTPALTVAIPFFNEERRLGAAIASVLAQTYRDFELLLVDDGSTDHSLDIARMFLDDRRVSLFTDGRRRHLAARLNEINLQARGRLVARMDADDLSHPERLARQVALLDARPDVSAVGCWVALVDDDDVLLCVTETGRAAPSPARALRAGLLVHGTMVARREWLHSHPYDASLTRTEDRDLWSRTVATTTFATLPEVLYAIHVRTKSPEFASEYHEVQRQNRRLFLRYGPTVLGWPRTMSLCASTVGKSLTVEVASALGMTTPLVRRRGRPPTESERVRVTEMLASELSVRSA